MDRSAQDANGPSSPRSAWRHTVLVGTSVIVVLENRPRQEAALLEESDRGMNLVVEIDIEQVGDIAGVSSRHSGPPKHGSRARWHDIGVLIVDVSSIVGAAIAILQLI